MKFARYAKYIGYYTPYFTVEIPSTFARYAKYIGYYTTDMVLVIKEVVC